MQFQVPQFIEVEDKIFGPLTFKQFIYVLGGAGAAYLIYRVLPIYFAAPLMLGVGGLAGALAFMEWNGRPFILALESAFYFILRTKLYLWNNEAGGRKSKKPAIIEATRPSEVYIPKLSDSRLHELAWSLDIKERIAAGITDQEDARGGVMAPVHTAAEARLR